VDDVDGSLYVDRLDNSKDVNTTYSWNKSTSWEEKKGRGEEGVFSI